ncbi:MAG: hypothetical protein JNL72_12460 [Flavipsychrobacter sp.]|nr:hypothetical protein [Flavipsychrobacter sp.]
MMKHIPFALNDAKQLCANLQNLIGGDFDPAMPDIGPIECVAVAPFDLQNKKQFLLHYLLCDDAHRALEEFHGLLYDVIIIARSLDITTDLVQYDIYTWLEKNNLVLSDVQEHRAAR